KAPIYASSTLTVNGTASLADITATGTLSLTGTTGTSTIASGQGFTIGTSQLVLQQTTGRLGIGTTTPEWLTQISGVRPQLTLSDTNGGTNLKHWTLSSQGGNFHIATSSDAFATGTTPAITISANNNVGLGTSSPSANHRLAVNGSLLLQSVTNSTRSEITNGGVISLFNNSSNSSISFGNGNDTGSIALSQISSSQLVITGSNGLTLTNTAGVVNIGTGSGNVGIASSTPAAKFSVHGNVYIDASITNVSNITATGTLSLTGTTGTSTIGVGQGFTIGTSQFVVQQNGNVGIATSSPMYGFTVATNTIAFNSDANGSLDVWATSTLPAAVQLPVTVAANGYVYVMSGDTGSYQSTVRFGKISSDGSIPTWSTTTSLPAARIAAAAVTVNGYIYFLGGANTSDTNQTTVWYAQINQDGTLGGWKNGTPLPAANGYHDAVTANGFIYLISGQAVNVYYAKANSDGSIGAWNTTTSLPEALQDFGVAVANGYVYTVGGRNTSGNSIATTYYAKLNKDGTIGSWTTNANNMPAARKRNNSVVINGYLYSFGGHSTVYEEEVYYAKLNPNGSTGVWTTSSRPLPGLRGWHGTVSANGYAYVIAGTDGTNRQNTIYYASGARTSFATTIDLLGLASTTLSDIGDQGSSIFAGSIFSNNSLEVAGSAQFWNNVGINGSLAITASSSIQQTNSIFSIQNATGTDPLLTVQYDGRFGIGTSTPQWLLQVTGSSTQRAMIGLSDKTAGVDLKHWTLSSQGGNFYIASSSDAFATSSAPAVMIDSNGRFGIGSSTPGNLTAALSIEAPTATDAIRTRIGRTQVFSIDSNGEVTFTRPSALSTTAFRVINSSGGVTLTVDTSGSEIISNGGFEGGGNSNSNTDPTFSSNSDTNTGMYFPAADTLGFTTGGTLRFGINPAGFVAITTTTPRWDFQIASSTGPMLALSDTSAGVDLKHWILSSRGGNFYMATSSDTTFATSSVPALMIDSNGLVGIGTSSPSSRLSIEGTCVDTGGGCADVAELYSASEDVQPGDILALDSVLNTTVKKANNNDGSRVIGIVSTNPAIVIEGSALQLLAGSNYRHQTRRPAVALSGRVPVKASTENGVIQIGDPITLASEAGTGKKATQSGRIVGYALETYSGATPENEGKVLVFVNLSYWLSPESLAQSSNTTSSQTEDPNLLASLIEGVKGWLQNAVAYIKEIVTEKITAKQLCLEDVCIDKQQLQTLLGSSYVPLTTEESVEEITAPEDTEPPVIHLNGPALIELEKGTSWADPGATVTDNVNDNLGLHFNVDGVDTLEVQIDTAVVSEHIIIYSATDQAGNIGTTTRQVNVIDTTIVIENASSSPEEIAE
ncbi:MAG TPA: immunoglobulin-like domain-containing protein, partial [Candidatus Paceibacterota bacterium]